MRILILNQAFYPDVVSTGQHATDLAIGLAERGHSVTVVASNRAYDDPTRRFGRDEVWRGIRVHRVTTTGFGKATKWRRAIDFAGFLINCSLCLMRLSAFDVVIALTTPPLIGLLGALFVRLRGGRLVYWVMDLNPDEAIAAGWLSPHSFSARGLHRLLRYILSRSACVIALDRFMQRRLLLKGAPKSRTVVLPPWSHDHVVQCNPEGRLRFRQQHGLAEKFVIMYSGNHSPCHPLDTVLQAALRVVDQTHIAFCFVGGGSDYRKVQRFAADHSLKNMLCLPYQPLETLSASLAAADLHVVVMGDAFVGIVHPCKIYNILAIGKPVLYVGPLQSHITDLLTHLPSISWFYPAQHGDVDLVVQHILRASCTVHVERNGQIALAVRFSQAVLLSRMIALVESLQDTAVAYR